MLQLAIVGGSGWIDQWSGVGCRLRDATITQTCKSAKQLAEPSFDAAIVECASDGSFVAELGKPLMVPFDASGLTDLALQCEQSGSLLTLFQPLRVLPSIQTLRQDLASGNLGNLGLVRLHRWSHSTNSQLANDLDVVLWLVGKKPTHVYATGSDGVSQVHLGFDENEMALLDYAELPAEEYYSLSVVASDGSAYADDHHNMNVLFDANGTRALTTSQGDLHLAAAANGFVAAVSSGSAAPIPVADAVRVQSVLEAAKQSRESGQVVSL